MRRTSTALSRYWNDEIAGDHEDRAEAGQFGDDVFSYAVAEILLLGSPDKLVNGKIATYSLSIAPLDCVIEMVWVPVTR